MSGRVLAIRHVQFEDLGSFAPWFAQSGLQVEYLDAGVDALAGVDVLSPALVVVLGGPIGAYQDALYPFLRDELALIRARLDAGRPLLGICLGAQLIARALGARVYPGPAVEIGWRLAREHWGLGYASEAAWTALRCGFDRLALNEIVSFTADSNLPSQKVMQAIGMHHDCADDFEHPNLAVDHPLRHHVLYRISREQWLQTLHG